MLFHRCDESSFLGKDKGRAKNLAAQVVEVSKPVHFARFVQNTLQYIKAPGLQSFRGAGISECQHGVIVIPVIAEFRC